MDVETAYLYGNLDIQIHISSQPDFFWKLPTPFPRRFLGLKINKAFYGLKQAGRM